MERDLVYNIMIAEIDKLGGKVDGVRQGKGDHRVIYWTTASGGKAATTVQRYNGDWRTPHHARRNIRRAARTVVVEHRGVRP